MLATDLSPEILALAQQNASRASYKQDVAQVADGEDLGVEAASFDAVVGVPLISVPKVTVGPCPQSKHWRG